MKVSPEILRLVPYSPGKPIDETKREFGLTKVTKLASNESPLPPSPKVLAALTQAFNELHRYPDASSYYLREALASYYQVSTDWLACGNGSNELIDLLIRIFCAPGEKILTSQAAFVAYKICAQAARVQTVEAPLTPDLRLNLRAMADAYKRTDGIRLIFLPNPNNPTGTYFNIKEFEEFLKVVGNRDDVLIVLDEAYSEFIRAEDCPRGRSYLTSISNLVCLHTMSKVFGLAGVRVGAVLARPSVIDLLQRVRNPFNINSLAQVAVVAALSDLDHVERVKQLTWSGLDFYARELNRLGLLHWPSQGNFVLFDTRRNADQVYTELLKRGVILRPVKNYGWPTYLRMSVGLPEECQEAIHALEAVLPQIAELPA